MEIETKAETGSHDPHIAHAMHEFLNQFEHFKEANETRLKELEEDRKSNV